MAISYDDLRAELNQARHERDRALAYAENLREQAEQAEAEKKAMRGAMCSAMDERNAARTEAEKLIMELGNVRRANDDLRSEAGTLREERDHYKAQAEGIRKAVRFAAPLRPCEAGSGCSRKVVGPGPLPDLMVPLREFVFNLPPGSSVTFKRGD